MSAEASVEDGAVSAIKHAAGSRGASDFFDAAALSDRTFGELLIRNARVNTRDQNEWESLTSEANIERAQRVLRALKETNTQALQARKARHESFRAHCRGQKNAQSDWFSANAEYEEWRRKVTKVARRIDVAISEVNKARRDNNRAKNERLRNERPVIRQLAMAIDRHRIWLADHDYEPSNADLELWAHLDSITLVTGADQRDVSLSDLLLYHWHAPESSTSGSRHEC